MGLGWCWCWCWGEAVADGGEVLAVKLDDMVAEYAGEAGVGRVNDSEVAFACPACEESLADTARVGVGAVEPRVVGFVDGAPGGADPCLREAVDAGLLVGEFRRGGCEVGGCGGRVGVYFASHHLLPSRLTGR